MKVLITILFLIPLIKDGKSQDTTESKPNSVYMEGFGIGMRYSINYERNFQIKESKWGLSISGGIAPNFTNPRYLYFPFRLGLNYSYRNSTFCAGLNYMWGFYWQQGFLHPEDLTWSTDYSLFPKIKYQYLFGNNLLLIIETNFISDRWEKGQNISKYLFDLPFNKLELYNNHFVVWPGFSIGYSF